MRLKILMWYTFLASTKRVKAMRTLARNKELPTRVIFEIVARLEVDSVRHAELIVDETRRVEAVRAKAAADAATKERSERRWEPPRNEIRASSPLSR